MKRVAGIKAVRAEQLALIIHKYLSDLFKQRVKRVYFGSMADIVPCLFNKKFAVLEFFLHKVRHKSRIALLNGLHSEFKLTRDYLLPKSDMLINPSFR